MIAPAQAVTSWENRFWHSPLLWPGNQDTVAVIVDPAKWLSGAQEGAGGSNWWCWWFFRRYFRFSAGQRRAGISRRLDWPHESCSHSRGAPACSAKP